MSTSGLYWAPGAHHAIEESDRINGNGYENENNQNF